MKRGWPRSAAPARKAGSTSALAASERNDRVDGAGELTAAGKAVEGKLVRRVRPSAVPIPTDLGADNPVLIGSIVQSEAQIAEGADETGRPVQPRAVPSDVADAGHPRALVVLDPFVAQRRPTTWDSACE